MHDELQPPALAIRLAGAQTSFVMSYTQFKRFVRDCGVSNATLHSIDAIFLTVNAERKGGDASGALLAVSGKAGTAPAQPKAAEKDEANTERELVMKEFVEAIVRLAVIQYRRSSAPLFRKVELFVQVCPCPCPCLPCPCLPCPCPCLSCPCPSLPLPLPFPAPAVPCRSCLSVRSPCVPT
jgi:hypothetical protein